MLVEEVFKRDPIRYWMNKLQIQVVVKRLLQFDTDDGGEMLLEQYMQ